MLKLEQNFPILGVSTIQNNGKVMDKGTHFHVHLVPRYADDGFWLNQKVFQHKIDNVLISKVLNKE